MTAKQIMVIIFLTTGTIGLISAFLAKKYRIFDIVAKVCSVISIGTFVTWILEN